jgi:hypothetical protein
MKDVSILSCRDTPFFLARQAMARCLATGNGKGVASYPNRRKYVKVTLVL